MISSSCANSSRTYTRFPSLQRASTTDTAISMFNLDILMRTTIMEEEHSRMAVQLKAACEFTRSRSDKDACGLISAICASI